MVQETSVHALGREREVKTKEWGRGGQERKCHRDTSWNRDRATDWLGDRLAGTSQGRRPEQTFAFNLERTECVRAVW